MSQKTAKKLRKVSADTFGEEKTIRKFHRFKNGNIVIRNFGKKAHEKETKKAYNDLRKKG